MESENILTHEEIWDDSVLVDSWNQALAEYNKYHSIHAKGGTLEEITAAEKKAVSHDAKAETNDKQPINDDDGHDEGEDDSMPMDVSDSDETPPSHPTISDPQVSADTKKQATGGPANVGSGSGPASMMGPGPGPQVLLGTIEDEGLKKLLMSWYYAGYYTGLYEGKQQGLQQQAGQARKSS
ncbi:hypothetical protein QBC35DRAFT_266176 [Podospora australis]|uniref:Survival motor neuron Tudor domain-containing protein n=1 Tax=Podospora australis TaxID=1536484 RepID=A0AAN7AGP8_9PEZI|nr:hypothetical protein QBC35DRAFT_266176 [Podospora australis]